MAKKPEEYDGSKPLKDPKQEFFCELFTTNTAFQYWGHGQNSYEFAYGYTQRIEEIEDKITSLGDLMRLPKTKRKGKSLAELQREGELLGREIVKLRRTCQTSASRLLLNAMVKARCNHLIDQLAEFKIVDRELLYMIQQRDDLDVKARAIEHHDKRAERVRDRIKLDATFDPIEVVTITKPVKAKV